MVRVVYLVDGDRRETVSDSLGAGVRKMIIDVKRARVVDSGRGRGQKRLWSDGGRVCGSGVGNE